MATILTNIDSDESLSFESRWYPPVRLFLSIIKRELMEKIHLIEQLFVLRCYTVYSLICQLCFFILCKHHLDNHQHIEDFRKYKIFISSISSILLYSIIGYFAHKVRGIWRGSRRANITSPSITSYLKGLGRILIEWVKAGVLVICLRVEGLEFEQNLFYCLITFSYFLCTEKVFLKIFPELIEALHVDELDDLEHLYVPMFMNLFAIAAGFTIVIYTFLFKTTSTSFILLSLYFMVYLRIKDVYYNYWEILVIENDTYLSCPVASKKEIEDWDDICAICLYKMSKARITPCNHLFHPYCLRLCLRRSLYCPLCNYCFSDVK